MQQQQPSSTTPTAAATATTTQQPQPQLQQQAPRVLSGWLALQRIIDKAVEIKKQTPKPTPALKRYAEARSAIEGAMSGCEEVDFILRKCVKELNAKFKDRIDMVNRGKLHEYNSLVALCDQEMRIKERMFNTTILNIASVGITAHVASKNNHNKNNNQGGTDEQQQPGSSSSLFSLPSPIPYPTLISMEDPFFGHNYPSHFTTVSASSSTAAAAPTMMMQRQQPSQAPAVSVVADTKNKIMATAMIPAVITAASALVALSNSPPLSSSSPSGGGGPISPITTTSSASAAEAPAATTATPA